MMEMMTIIATVMKQMPAKIHQKQLDQAVNKARAEERESLEGKLATAREDRAAMQRWRC